MSQMPGGYIRTYVGNDPFGKPMYRDEPGTEWVSRASAWPVTVVSRETEPGHFLAESTGEPRTQIHLTCATCAGNPSAFCLSADTEGPGYTVTLADLLAGILGHIRRSHPDVVAS